MIGGFHGSTNALWSLYGKEAKSHDEARILPLKEDMDGVLIFVRRRTHNRLCHADTYLTVTGWSIFGRPHAVRR